MNLSVFQVEFGPRIEKDLRALKDKKESFYLITEIERELSKTPWPFGKLKKKIQGLNYVLYRLRLDTKKDSYRAFYTIVENKIIVLRLVPKKLADRIIESLK